MHWKRITILGHGEIIGFGASPAGVFRPFHLSLFGSSAVQLRNTILSSPSDKIQQSMAVGQVRHWPAGAKHRGWGRRAFGSNCL